MPSKKGGKHTKRATPKKAPAAQAQAPAPTEPAAIPDEKEPVNHAETLVGRFYQPHHLAARRLMWIGVACCAIIIIVLWGWSIKLRIQNVSWQKTNEGQLVEQTKQNWDASFAEERASTEARATSVREEIKSVVDTLLTNAASTNTPAASSTSSTVESASSTKASTTTQKTKTLNP